LLWEREATDRGRLALGSHVAPLRWSRTRSACTARPRLNLSRSSATATYAQMI